MGPDEHHDHVNNSVYTNEVAKLALALPSLLYKKLMNTTLKPPKSEYLEIAKNLYSPFDNAKMIHPEFDGYNSSLYNRNEYSFLSLIYQLVKVISLNKLM